MSRVELGQVPGVNRTAPIIGWAVAALFALALALLLPSSVSADQQNGPIPDRYIVVLEDDVAHPGRVAERHAENRDAKVRLVYNAALKGYAAKLEAAEVKAVERDPTVAFVEPDYRGGAASQTTPTGIDRIFATANAELEIDEEDDRRVDVDVAVIDSGIDASHPDLDVVAHVDCDDNPCVEGGTYGTGHGTHVAGTIGAIDNGFGVVGVAPGARLWGIRVLDNKGTGDLSEYIDAINWVTATREDEDPENDIEVANSSLHYPPATFSEAFNIALEASIDAGIVHVAAAGNSSETVQYVPGNHPDMITVSAIQDTDGKPGEEVKDELAWFSNFGNLVDVTAPGVLIDSTLPEGKYGSNTGTSMAAPHVAGAAAILAAEDNPESAEDVEAISNTVAEEGNLDWKDTSKDSFQERLLEVSDEVVFGDAPLGVYTKLATGVTVTEAVLNGTINPEGSETKYQFEYGTTTEYGASVPVPEEAIGSGTKDVAVEEKLEGLEQETTYHFRVVAENKEGTTEGKDRTFTTLSSGVRTEAATDVSLEGATLHGTINPEGSETEYQFEYGTTTEYGTSVPVPAEAVGNGTEDVEVEEAIESLEPETTYHYRLVATNEAGTRVGKDRTVTTIPLPAVQTAAATGVIAKKATLRGTVNPKGFETTYQFEYGKTTSYGTSVPVPAEAIGDGTEDVEVEEGIQGLKPETTYHYRLVATNGGGATKGKDMTFTTTAPTPPVVQTDAATGITGKGATLRGAVNPKGLTTSYYFEYGKTTSYGTKVPASPKAIGSGSGNVAVSDAISGLELDTTYHFRVVATNVDGISKGADKTFKTLNGKPAVSMLGWSELGGTQATLTASINPEGLETTYQFEYGKTTSYGTKVPVSPKSIGSGTSNTWVSEEISGLEPGTTYYYRVVASNSKGTNSMEKSFTPVATEYATGVSETEATLNGTINPESSETEYQFEYGTTTEYGEYVPVSPEAIGDGTEGVEVSEELEELAPNTTYHYRLVAWNGEGTREGEDMTFTTGADAVTFAVEEEPLEVGTKIRGVSENVSWIGGGCYGGGFVEPIEFVGELTENEVAPATVEIPDFPVIECEGPGNNWRLEFIDIEITPVHFFADEAVKYKLDFYTINWYNGESLIGVCKDYLGESYASSNEWNSPAEFTFLNQLKFIGCAVPGTGLNGDFELMLEDETPIEILADE